MTLELWNTLATMGTFLVIATTAIVAVVQLQHARGSNQIVALNDLRESTARPEFDDAQHFVMTDLAGVLRDSAFRYQFAHSAARTSENQKLISKANIVGNFYEDMGVLIKRGLVDRALVIEIWGTNAVGAWENLAPVTAMVRRNGNDSTWENFEYFTKMRRKASAFRPGI